MQTQEAVLLFAWISASNTHSTFAIQALPCCLLHVKTLALEIYNIAYNYPKRMMDVFSLSRGRMLYERYNEW